jgi:hypothetical protein
MIGTIVSFSNQTAAGVVKSADGARFDFDVAAVLAYDVAELAAGQPVHFEVADGVFPKAINVSIDPLRPIDSVIDHTREIRRLRYMGFDQRGSIRAYRYQRIVPGETTQMFTVDTDLMLFQKYHVAIQEGPVLCLRLLSAELASGGAPGPCAFTERHMASFLASRPAPGAKSGGRKARRAEEASSV